MADHIRFGNKYITSHKENRIFSRGDFYGYKDGVWLKLDIVRKELWNLSTKNGSTANAAYVGSVLDYLREHYRQPDDLFDNNPDLICLKNYSNCLMK